MACTACHLAKRKCDKKSPCSRCISKGLECIPHISRQGKKKVRRIEEKKDDGLDRLLLEQVTGTEPVQGHTHHFGLKYLVRSWISFAFKRRSFHLMQRGCALAIKVGFSMDEIFCEQPNSREMDFLKNIILVPMEAQHLYVPTPLQWTEIPERLLRNTDTIGSSGNREGRWIWMREMVKGESRYLVSEAFERDIAPWSSLQKAWEDNRGAVIDLFVIAEDKHKHTKSFAHQISLYKDQVINGEGNRLTRTRVRLRSKNEGILMVDQVTCLEIVNLDVAYLFAEYVRVEPEPINATHPAKNNRLVNTGTFFEYFDLDNIVLDDDLEQIFNLVQ
ncbi:hypothetical protein FisN_2Lh148 [Fistulifera solaris]|uniref:Zn(2)-C6 fungal-type domain-containing protein n=1 Tax=Fistulifera solaris TaxID=1519565 RepID=A0A1Z5KF80_FISSO|nr:hypothetical protein FisN_2Lh148 [Fistulifera solaris]|eukprot:GAX24877.1 hypothetical protein FisN_2Lh148 [Fistulifera solaris]